MYKYDSVRYESGFEMMFLLAYLTNLELKVSPSFVSA